MAFTMERLSELNAVSGNEDEAREYIIPLIKDKCESIEVDSMGNIVAFKKGKSDKYKVLVGTNIDEVGFIVSDITDSGFVKFKSVGEIDPRTLVSKCVNIGKDRIPGIIGMKAIHLQKREEREAAVKVKDLYADIGADSKKTAQKKVTLGDRISFNTRFSELGDTIKGKALDRFGTIALFYAMDEKPAYDTYFVFATQREVPASLMGRGMRIAAHRINPDFALIVNTVNSDDFDGVKKPSARLGNGAVIEYMDRTSISNLAFLNAIDDLAKKHEIMTQKKTSSIGTSQIGAVQSAASGAVTASVAITCRYSHAPVSYMNKKDIDAVTELVKAFIKESDVVTDGIIKDINAD